MVERAPWFAQGGMVQVEENLTGLRRHGLRTVDGLLALDGWWTHPAARHLATLLLSRGLPLDVSRAVMLACGHVDAETIDVERAKAVETLIKLTSEGLSTLEAWIAAQA